MRSVAWAGVLAGLWLIVAPFVIGYDAASGMATTQAVVTGILISAVALWLALSSDAPRYVDYLMGVFGIWSVAAPFVLGYRHIVAAMYSDVIAGLVVLLAAAVSVYGRTHSRDMTPRAA